mmetsp:Transcript_6956/g.16595  ORF Transcript_6956/g.16595 Transcript_6956/m.16595 type:complete len:360 (+) Transcript_6956:219-1298(+)
MIHKGKGHHCLYHWNSTGEHTRIMTTLATELHLLTISCHGVLRLSNSRSWFECYMNNNVLSITDTALYASRSVCSGSSSPGLGINIKFVVVILACKESTSKAIARLESLGGGDRHAGLGKVCLELVKHRRTNTGWNVPRHASNNPPDGVAALPNLINPFQHFLGGSLIRTANNVGIDLLHGKSGIIDIGSFDILNLGHICKNFDAIVLVKDLPRHGTSSDATDCLTGGTTSSSSDGTNAILGIVGSIGMRWTIRYLHIIVEVIARSLVLIPNKHANGSADGDAIGRHPAQDFDGIGLISWGGDSALTRTPTVKVNLDFLARQRNTRRTSIESYPDASTVRFTPRRYSEQTAIGVASPHG